jgi:hypothetical protein
MKSSGSPRGPLATLLSVEPVLRIVERVEADETTGHGLCARHGISQAGRVLPVTDRTIHRWRAAGGLTAMAADTFACALGRHPAELWGNEWWELGT